MSLESTAKELREMAHDLRHPDERPYDNDPEELAAHLSAIASELESYPKRQRRRLLIPGMS